MDIFDSLIRIRKEQKVDQKKMLHTLGISATTLSRYESKKRSMPFKTMVKYAEYLGYEIKLMVK